MGLEDFIPSESGADAGPKSSEVSEKFKEAVKKAGAGIKRVQKDEKKARKFDLLLAQFLTQIIRNPKYDFLLDDLFKTLDSGYSSNFLLGILSLVYLPISDKIRELSTKEIIEFDYVKTFQIVHFDDNNLDEQIKNRINFWLEDITDIISIEYSSLQISQIKTLFIKKEAYNQLVIFSSLVFKFFFEELNIEISQKKSQNYIDFIMQQVYTKIQTLESEEV
ncbi:MAG: hypothetical protein AB7E37_01945 [Candidatus Altimarinota bacterium]